MYENEVIEVVNNKTNKKLKEWYNAKVKEIALLLIDKLESQSIHTQTGNSELSADVVLCFPHIFCASNIVIYRILYIK